jgi:hypothetical protein
MTRNIVPVILYYCEYTKRLVSASTSDIKIEIFPWEGKKGTPTEYTTWRGVKCPACGEDHAFE